MPSISTNTGSVVLMRKLPHDSTKSPVCSATQAAPAAPSAINNRNRMIRIIEILIAPVWRARPWHRPQIGGTRPARHRAHRPFQPGLRRGTVGRLQRLQFPPRFIGIVAQRRRGDPRHHGAAIIADGVGALDRDQFGRARLQPLDDARTGRGIVLLRRQQFRHQRQQFRAELAGVRHALGGKLIERLQGHRDWAPALSPPPAPPDRDRRSGPAHRAARAATTRRSGRSSAGLAVGRLGIGNLAALLRDLGALRSHQALDLRDALVDRGKIRRSGAVGARRGFHVIDGGRQACRFARAQPRGHRATRRAIFPGLRCAQQRRDRRTGLPTFDSRPATRAVRPSMAALELRGGVRGRLNRGPSQHPADADHQRGGDRAGDRRDDPGRDRRRAGAEIGAAADASASGSAAGSDAAALSAGDGRASACDVALDTSVASRSMVGGARLGRSESGSDPVSSGLSSTITAVPLTVRCRNLAESGRLRPIAVAAHGPRHGPGPRTGHFRPPEPPP